MSCLPCEKEVINSSALHRTKNLRRLARMLPAMVKNGQANKEFAEKWLKRVISLEYTYCEEGEKLEEEFVSNTKSPWDA